LVYISEHHFHVLITKIILMGLRLKEYIFDLDWQYPELLRCNSLYRTVKKFNPPKLRPNLIRNPVEKFDFCNRAMTSLPKSSLEWMLKLLYSYNFLTKAS